jgi:Holliday junction resolvasome RuvABC endonuclease subunit
MIIGGIDYSLTSPAICVHEGNEWKVENCKFYYNVHKEKNVVVSGQFYGFLYPEYESDCHRYDNLAAWSEKILKDSNVEKVFIEGYAFGAVGRVFQIAENAGLLKHKIWKSNIPYQVFAPSEIKKHATGKGNSNKEKLYEAFLNETNVDIRKKLDIINHNQWNPLSDIVDSYYIAKLGFMKEKENENHS